MSRVLTESKNFYSDLDMLFEAIDLQSEDFAWAVDVSNQIATEVQRWRVYLNSLALCGFQYWLELHSNQFRVNINQCSLFYPEYGSILTTVCGIEVNDFRLCLIVADELSDEVIVDKAIIDLAEFIPHYYVLIEVVENCLLDEEPQGHVEEEEEELAAGRVIIRGHLQYTQLLRHRRQANLDTASELHYHLPLTWFNLAPTQLLQDLKFIDPAKIALPVPQKSLRTQLASVWSSLQEQVLLWKTNSQQCWEGLTWQQYEKILTCPPLLQFIYALQMQSEKTEAIATQIADMINALATKVINVVRNNEFWSSPQYWVTEGVTRLIEDKKFKAALDHFIKTTEETTETREKTKLEIPQTAQYIESTLNEDLKLRIMTWVSSRESSLEWTLLVFLVAQVGKTLRPGTGLCIANTTLLDQVQSQAGDLYIATSPVTGTLDEEFVVSIKPPGELPIVLPSLIYQPEP